MGTPAIYVTVAPKDAMDQEKMSNVPTKLMREYPSVKMDIDPKTHQTIIFGAQEMLLEIVLDRLIHELDVPVNVSKPYRL